LSGATGRLGELHLSRTSRYRLRVYIGLGPAAGA